jgi:aconitate hydratase
VAGDVERLADHLFAVMDPEFGARARAEGQGWIVAGRELGRGPRREEIGLAAVTLGIRGMMARSFDPEFRRLLCQYGLLALRFAADLEATMIGLGDELEIPDLPEGLEQGKPLVVRNLTRGLQVTVHHDLDEAEVAVVRGGGLLAGLRREPVGVAAGAKSESED